MINALLPVDKVKKALADDKRNMKYRTRKDKVLRMASFLEEKGYFVLGDDSLEYRVADAVSTLLERRHIERNPVVPATHVAQQEIEDDDEDEGEEDEEEQGHAVPGEELQVFDHDEPDMFHGSYLPPGKTLNSSRPNGKATMATAASTASCIPTSARERPWLMTSFKASLT